MVERTREDRLLLNLISYFGFPVIVTMVIHYFFWHIQYYDVIRWELPGLYPWYFTVIFLGAYYFILSTLDSGERHDSYGEL